VADAYNIGAGLRKPMSSLSMDENRNKRMAIKRIVPVLLAATRLNLEG